jgi:isopenicillin N synthase-like dioxygenase
LTTRARRDSVVAVRDLVPVIDISGWTSGRRDRIAREVDDACRRVGFLQVAGHGVDPAVVSAMLAASDAIFELPAADKLALTAPPHINRGYAPVGSESLTYSLGVDAPPDLFEAFNLGPEPVPADDPIYAGELEGVFAPNIWPPSLPAIRAALLEYFHAAGDLARRLISIFAVSLDLPDDHFVPCCDHATEMLRLNNYVRGPGGAPLPGQQRMGAHTDYGIVTVLYGDRVPGLEIVGPDGEWHGVLPEEGMFLVNLGDVLARWTNDRWRSTVHRVVPPPSGDGPARRRSAAFFHDGNYDALVECLPTCVGAGETPRYPPVIAGEHLKAKLLSGRSRSTEPYAGVTDTIGERISAVTGDLPD